MKLSRSLILASFFTLLVIPQALAEPDFFGVKMKGEDFAKNVIVLENNKVPDFSNNRPGTDKRIYAYAFTSTTIGGGKGIGVQVYNHSEQPFRTDRIHRELTLITRDGKRYDRSEAEMMWTKEILMPGESALFNFKFPGIRVDKEEIRLIICSFDLDETMIFLFPLRPYESHAAAQVPDDSTAEGAPKKKRLSDWLGFGTKAQKAQAANESDSSSKPRSEAGASGTSRAVPSAAVKTEHVQEGKHCVTPLKMVQSFLRGLGGQKEEQVSRDPKGVSQSTLKNAPPLMAASPRSLLPGVPYQEFVIPGTQETLKVPYHEGQAQAASFPTAHNASGGSQAGTFPLVSSEEVMDDVKYNFRPNYREEVQRSQKETDEKMYQDRPWSIQNPDQYMPYSKMMEFPKGGVPRRQAQVLMVNPDYGFVVVNAGYEDGFEKNLILDVLRNGRKIGKVMVTKPRDKIAGAIVLTEWRTATDIRVGDLVGVSG